MIIILSKTYTKCFRPIVVTFSATNLQPLKMTKIVNLNQGTRKLTRKLSKEQIFVRKNRAHKRVLSTTLSVSLFFELNKNVEPSMN